MRWPRSRPRSGRLGMVMAAVVEYGTPMVDDPARMLGVEALRGGPESVPIANGRHHTQFITGMIDVSAARLLDVVLGRSGATLSQWIAALPQPWRDTVNGALHR